MSARPGFRGEKRFETRSDQRVDQLRIPPQSIEAEQAVLGGLMLAPDSYDRIADQLNDSDFYRRDHQLIYRAIRELAEKNRPFDAVTLGEWFDSQGYAEQIGGGAYLVELATTTPSAANIRRYAEIVNETATDQDGTGEPYRINKQGQIANSLILTNPLLGSPSPHPAKLLIGADDPRYQTIYTWISQGWQNN